MIFAGILVSVFTLAYGIVGLIAWCLDRRDARMYANFRAMQLVAWAELEADVIAAERAIGVRHA